MKRVLVMAVCVAAVLATWRVLFTETTASRYQDKIILRWLTDGNPARLAQVAEFEKLHPDIHVVVEPEREFLLQRTLIQVSGGRGPDLVEIGFTLGWPLFAPPDVPAERVAVLRQAFARLVEDPEFARVAQTALHIELDPVLGAELTGYVDQALSTPRPLVDEAIRMLGL